MPNLLNAPIPGQSLTNAPGGAPWEYPPKFVDPDEALEYLEDLFMRRKTLTPMLGYLKDGVSAEELARGFLLAGFMKGLWNPDLLLLIAPVTMYMIAAIGEAKGVSVKVKKTDKKYNKILDNLIDVENRNKKEAPELPIKESMSILKGIG